MAEDPIREKVVSDVPLGMPKEPNPAREAWLKKAKETMPKKLEHINNIENPDLINTPVTVEAVISSPSASYIVPSQLKGTLKEDAEDEQRSQDQQVITPKISIKDPLNLSLVAVSQETKYNRLTRYFKEQYPRSRVVNREELAYRTVYTLRVRPPVFTLEKQDDKIIDEKGYEYKYLDLYVASDTSLTFQPSTLMRITGLPLPNPRTQKTTILSYAVEFLEDTFSYDVEKLKQLQTFFIEKNVKERLSWILENFELYSHIFGRKDVATAALLGYFTPLYVQFNGEIQRGWGIIGVIGDTTTGKSETIKKLSKLLKAGSVISAETASTVGLTGTVFQLEHEGWSVEWGFLPLMDKKLLAIDGSHKLNASCWAALAEAERSGVLSMAKAAKNTAHARTRQIRIYNAVDQEADKYSTKSLSCFLYPAQALTTVLDKTSIARLDMAVFSDQRDVTPERINQQITEHSDPLLENMAEVLKWVWSNKAQVEWTDQAVKTLLDGATELYKKFFYEAIPLVSIDVKYKIARLSVALAYCTLSTNEAYNIVTVTDEHVKNILNFLTEEYTKTGLGLLAQQQKYEILTPEDVSEIILKVMAQLYKNPIENLIDVLSFIVTQNHTTNDEIKQKFGLTENNQARPLIATLKTEGLLLSKRAYYATPKLIEAYKVTDGFKNLPNFNGDNGSNGAGKEHPHPKKRDKNLNQKYTESNYKLQQQLLENGVGESYSESVNNVISVKNNEQSSEKSALEEKRKPIFYVKTVPSGEKCDCGELAVTKEVLTPQFDVLRRCENCFQTLRGKFPNAEWKAAYPDMPSFDDREAS